MKVGDSVVCIRNCENCLIKGKIYVIKHIRDESYCSIVGIVGFYFIYGYYFINLKEMREKKLERILK